MDVQWARFVQHLFEEDCLDFSGWAANTGVTVTPLWRWAVHFKAMSFREEGAMRNIPHERREPEKRWQDSKQKLELASLKRREIEEKMKFGNTGEIGFTLDYAPALEAENAPSGNTPESWESTWISCCMAMCPLDDPPTKTKGMAPS